ncbi:MAG: hypothetical protein QW548_01130 [Candidatus Aenigmatarchaeota archaeon]
MARLFLATNGTHIGRRHEQALRVKLAEYLMPRGYMHEFREAGIHYTWPSEGRGVSVVPERPSVEKPAYAVYIASEQDRMHGPALKRIFESLGFAVAMDDAYAGHQAEM